MFIYLVEPKPKKRGYKAPFLIVFNHHGCLRVPPYDMMSMAAYWDTYTYPYVRIFCIVQEHATLRAGEKQHGEKHYARSKSLLHQNPLLLLMSSTVSLVLADGPLLNHHQAVYAILGNKFLLKLELLFHRKMHSYRPLSRTTTCRFCKYVPYAVNSVLFRSSFA